MLANTVLRSLRPKFKTNKVPDRDGLCGILRAMAERKRVFLHCHCPWWHRGPAVQRRGMKNNRPALHSSLSGLKEESGMTTSSKTGRTNGHAWIMQLLVSAFEIGYAIRVGGNQAFHLLIRKQVLRHEIHKSADFR